MVFDRLTEKDKTLIMNYITHNVCTPTVSIEQLLKPWSDAKDQYLSKIFKDQLIIEKPIEFFESPDQICEKISNIYDNDERYRHFVQRMENAYSEVYEGDYWEDARYSMAHILGFYCLSQNKLNEDRLFRIKGKGEFRFQKGTKPMKIIAKMAKLLNVKMDVDEKGVSDFEYFRRKHSTCLNQKKLKGNLCFSIHPLDYMTMSDNAENWHSCMSWLNHGDYRHGTVTMMNSPCVVVAYLASETNKLCVSNDFEWNSKKWRCLFIVDKNFILSVKDYPYFNPDLIKTCIKELAAMAGWGEGIEVKKFEPGYFEEDKYPVINNRQFGIDPRCDVMYNDFGTTDHYATTNPEDFTPLLFGDYYYSGVSECMRCGHTDTRVHNEDSSLECDSCYPGECCDMCGDTLDYDYTYTTADDYRVCEYCYDNCCVDEFLSEARWRYADDLVTVAVYKSKNDDVRMGSIIIDPKLINPDWWEWKDNFPNIKAPREPDEKHPTSYVYYDDDMSEDAQNRFDYWN